MSSYTQPFYFDDQTPPKARTSWIVLDFKNSPETYAVQMDYVRYKLG